MLLETSQEYDKRVRAVRKRLTLEFQPLKDTLAKGLDVLIDVGCACGPINSDRRSLMHFSLL